VLINRGHTNKEINFILIIYNLGITLGPAVGRGRGGGSERLDLHRTARIRAGLIEARTLDPRWTPEI
jgi:hypothetical protein